MSIVPFVLPSVDAQLAFAPVDNGCVACPRSITTVPEPFQAQIVPKLRTTRVSIRPTVTHLMTVHERVDVIRRFFELDRTQKLVERLSIAICAPTRSGEDWRSLHDAPLQTLLIPSIVRTVSVADRSKYVFKMYVAADLDDVFWRNQYKGLQAPRWLPVHFGFYEGPVHKIPFNSMMRDAHIGGADYLVRVNDDSEFISSHWVSRATAKLASYEPPNVGMVGPTCLQEGNNEIMTHDFVHRTHFEIFNDYYPDVFSSWWVDDWISKVYGPNRSTKISDWHVKHHLHKQRYRVRRHKEGFLDAQLKKGARRIEAWLSDRRASHIARIRQPECNISGAFQTSRSSIKSFRPIFNISSNYLIPIHARLAKVHCIFKGDCTSNMTRVAKSKQVQSNIFSQADKQFHFLPARMADVSISLLLRESESHQQVLD